MIFNQGTCNIHKSQKGKNKKNKNKIQAIIIIIYRCNMLIRRFYNCSVAVKQRLFKSFCLCFYDVDHVALWSNFTAFSYNKLKSACEMLQNILRI